MIRALAGGVLVAGLWLWPSALAAQTPRPQQRTQRPRTVAVRVVDLSAEVAYVEPGGAEGVSTGRFATFGTKRFWITATSASYAQLALEGQPLAIGAVGHVLVAPSDAALGRAVG